MKLQSRVINQQDALSLLHTLLSITTHFFILSCVSAVLFIKKEQGAQHMLKWRQGGAISTRSIPDENLWLSPEHPLHPLAPLPSTHLWPYPVPSPRLPQLFCTWMLALREMDGMHPHPSLWGACEVCVCIVGGFWSFREAKGWCWGCLWVVGKTA